MTATERTISVAQARRIYDRIGRAQDTQSFYEQPALEALFGGAGFERAGSVLELGCGTGKLARRLLAGRLPPDARYVGLDVSPRMVAIARGRLLPWAARAEVSEADALRPLPVADDSVDRVVATYVFDLLAAADAEALLAEVRRVLAPGGTLCAAGITGAAGGLGAVVAGGWRLLFKLRPELTGGCRPIELAGYMAADRWRIERRTVVRAWGVSSEVVIAAPRTGP